MKKSDFECCYPLRRKRGPDYEGDRKQVPLFVKVVVLCLMAVMIAGVVHIFTGQHDFSHKHSIGHTVFSLLIVAVIVIVVLRLLFAPIRRLKRGVQALADGNLDYRFDECPRGEFGKVAVAFNQMSQEIQETLQSKTQLLLDVSHELRSPLTRIKIALEMAPDMPQKDSMMQDVREMEAMLTELLESESLKTGNGSLVFKELELVQIIEAILPKYLDRAPGILFSKSNNQFLIPGDERRIKCAIQNVLENGLKYSKSSTSPVEISIKQESETAVVSIRDYGEGINKEEQLRIFEPFYRTDKSRNRKSGGYGLGLSLCNEIMRAHKGDIVVKSKPGEGTEIQLIFPLTKSSNDSHTI